jgi:hypothetical protein
MGRLILVALALVLVVLIGGGVFLASWNIPAPSKTVEKVIPDARFPK